MSYYTTITGLHKLNDATDELDWSMTGEDVDRLFNQLRIEEDCHKRINDLLISEKIIPYGLVYNPSGLVSRKG